MSVEVVGMFYSFCFVYVIVVYVIFKFYIWKNVCVFVYLFNGVNSGFDVVYFWEKYIFVIVFGIF